METGLDDRVVVHSSGTGGWHVGGPMDRRAAATLTAAGYDPSRHRARQYDDSWADTHDLVLAMDHENLADLGGRSERVGMFRDFDPVDPGADAARPLRRRQRHLRRGAPHRRAHRAGPHRRARHGSSYPGRRGERCRSHPCREAARELLRGPNPAVIAVSDAERSADVGGHVVPARGRRHGAGQHGRRRARLRWIQERPEVSLTVLKEEEWYTHVSLRGPVVRWEHDEQAALADIDRLARHYTGHDFGNRTASRVSAWIEITHWHGWDLG